MGFRWRCNISYGFDLRLYKEWQDALLSFSVSSARGAALILLQIIHRADEIEQSVAQNQRDNTNNDANAGHLFLVDKISCIGQRVGRR